VPHEPQPMAPLTEPLSDTPPEVRKVLIEGYRRMSPQEKMRRVLDLNRTVEAMAAARLRRDYGPELSERELRLRLTALRLDRETMIEVFGWDPEVEGY
jgi:hypothetical protein